jgi:hypothetical protein
MDYQTTLATELAIDIMLNGYHQPLVNGKANVEKIEDEVVKGIYMGELKEITQETVNMAIVFVDDIIKEFGDSNG